MKFGFNWQEKTTKLGAMVIAGMLIALAVGLTGHPEKTETVKDIFGWGIGILGLAVRD